MSFKIIFLHQNLSQFRFSYWTEQILFSYRTVIAHRVLVKERGVFTKFSILLAKHYQHIVFCFTLSPFLYILFSLFFLSFSLRIILYSSFINHPFTRTKFSLASRCPNVLCSIVCTNSWRTYRPLQTMICLKISVWLTIQGT